MADVAKVDNVALASIAAVNGTAIASIAAILGQTVPAGGIALVQQKVGTTADGSGTLYVNPDSTCTVGNTVIACLSFLDTASFGEPVSCGGGSLTEAVTATITGVKVYIYYLYLTGAETEFFYGTDLPVRASMHISEWSGLANAAPENTQTNTDTNTAMSIAKNVDATSGNNLVIGIGGYVNATDAYSSGPNNSFTRLTATGGASVFQECGYLIRTADHAVISSDVTLSSSLAWANAGAAFGGA